MVGTDALEEAVAERRGGEIVERTRRCTCCGAVKPVDGYDRDAKGRDGLQSACKTCHKQRVHDYRERLREADELRAPPHHEKRCGRCEQVRPSGEFHRNRSTPDGLHWVCAPCNRDPTSRGPIERRRTIRNYGLTRDEYDQMLVDQAFRCAICERPFPESPHIDHDHATGEVRGLLCRRCNLGLGHFADDVRRLGAAIAYLGRGGARTGTSG